MYGKGIHAPWAVSIDGNDNVWINNLSNARSASSSCAAFALRPVRRA